MQYVICLASNGEILRFFSGAPDDASRQIGPGERLVEGVGSWLTHWVVGDRIVPLDVVRVPPFEGAAWDAAHAQWFDPLQRADTVAAARVERRCLLTGKIEQAEQRQARPIREIQVAQALGKAMPEPAVATLHAIEQEITALRLQLVALA